MGVRVGSMQPPVFCAVLRICLRGRDVRACQDEYGHPGTVPGYPGYAKPDTVYSSTIVVIAARMSHNLRVFPTHRICFQIHVVLVVVPGDELAKKKLEKRCPATENIVGSFLFKIS